ncbi:unnamed protein product [Adineta steineri]|uniref:Innexin n=1 Tax=Adineta steineri TaxID=433720 RepID=A0A814LB40_9BILA|nr:unnamed protein product [Adineta steineri]CAF0959140.1 unnamed protein product [Adineta steineri]CAF1062293.1 unnamed protein product [Adineta steineri]CAF3936392.1 unnamed protein product [Adineta steineri]CAF4075136.1 unnamed protein product [Adineta steineri]
MSLYLITDAFRKLGSPDIKNDDIYDRISRKYSLVILGVSFLIVSSSQFIGNPINCYTQNMGSHAGYVNWVCWISSSYYLPFDQPLPSRYEKRPENIPYYQWVPFILLCMMFLFYMPGFIWRNLNKACGINTKIISKMVTDLDQLDGEKREKAVRGLAKHIDKALAYHREYEYGLMYNIRRRAGSILCCTMGRHSGNHLAFTYILVKLLYIGNAIGQLFLLNVFMGRGFSLIGFEVMNRWWNNQDLEVVERFPRITMCQFIIRTLGDNIQPYDVQCLLPINIYNEKIFMMIWFWLAFVAITSVYGLIKWFYYFTTSARINFVQRFLEANEIRYYKSSTPRLVLKNEHDDHTPYKRVEDFVENYCRQDGLLLLRIIKKNTNNVIAGEVICALWDNWKVLPQIRFNTSIESDNGGQSIGLGVKNPLKQNNMGEVNEKLLSPM